MSIRSGKEAIAHAKGEHYRRTRNWTNLCLMFVRMCFGVSSRYASAETAYYNTKKRHTSWPPPAGVPVWWTNGRYGHVALSTGNGYCWSNDFKRRGYIDHVKIADITRYWGQRYRGWTEDINGVDVYDPRPTLDASAIARRTRRNLSAPQGKFLKRAVAAEVGKGRMFLRNGVLGPAFRKQYKLVQAKYLKSQGAKVTDKNADGIPGFGSLSWLGRRHDFKVEE